MQSDSLLRHGSSALRYPEWQRPYEAALLEVDPDNLAMCIEEAEAAIYERLQQLREMSESQDRQGERQALKGAIYTLKILRRESLNFPDWESGSVHGDAA